MRWVRRLVHKFIGHPSKNIKGYYPWMKCASCGMMLDSWKDVRT